MTCLIYFLRSMSKIYMKIKKNLVLIIFSLVIFSFALPMVCTPKVNEIIGLGGFSIPTAFAVCNADSSFFCSAVSFNSLEEGGDRIIGMILGTIGSIALLLFIISGIMYMTAAGAEEKITAAKKILTGTVIGLAIAMLAYSLLKVLISIL